MFLIDWIYRLLYGEDAANDLNKPPTRRKK